MGLRRKRQSDPFTNAPILVMRFITFLLFLEGLSPMVIAERFILYQVKPEDERGMRMLRKWQNMDHKYKVDFWKEPQHLGDAADVMISEKYVTQMERRFRRGNIAFSVKVSDVENLKNNLADLDFSRVGRLKKIKYPFGDYASYSDMMKYMRTIEFYYPNITKIIRLGTTHEGKPIEGLKERLPNSQITLSN
uniref:Propep_M14 domain-containing protein n=1 Tax=Heterorhabditis bacteriophora TaxID=37862 RepID=A0A1I7WNE6_HETBA